MNHLARTNAHFARAICGRTRDSSARLCQREERRFLFFFFREVSRPASGQRDEGERNTRFVREGRKINLPSARHHSRKAHYPRAHVTLTQAWLRAWSLTVHLRNTAARGISPHTVKRALEYHARRDIADSNPSSVSRGISGSNRAEKPRDWLSRAAECATLAEYAAERVRERERERERKRVSTLAPAAQGACGPDAERECRSVEATEPAGLPERAGPTERPTSSCGGRATNRVLGEGKYCRAPSKRRQESAA